VATGVTSYRSTPVSTPIGDLLVVVSDRGVVWTMFIDDDVGPELDRLMTRLGSSILGGGARALTPLRREVEAYFRGTGRSFATPVDLELVPEGFGRRVLEATMAIPFGELATYGDVAASAGSLRAGRAAGGALSRCPIELFVPCHRVVHAGGTIGGYGRHEARKRWLLRHEGAI
jgi:methylated-DNA-[protein]-cysteine S-methyltransferase